MLRPSASAASQGPVSNGENNNKPKRRAGPSTEDKVQSRVFIEIKDRSEWQFSSLTKNHSDTVDIQLGLKVKSKQPREQKWKS